MADCDLSLPCSSTCADSACTTGPAFQINNPFGLAMVAFGLTGGLQGNVDPDSIGTGVQGSTVRGTGVLGTSTQGIGVIGAGGDIGVQGESTTGRAGSFQLSNELNPNVALYAATRGRGSAIEGLIDNPGNDQAAVRGVTNSSGAGVSGSSSSGVGVSGSSSGGLVSAGVSGVSSTGFISIGVMGLSNGGGVSVGVYGRGTGQNERAAIFDGRVDVAGFLEKSGGGFTIDHPLDPVTKYLRHSFVESPDMKNVYDGVVILDDTGEAVVELPDWFETLNGDFRYQLTCIGRFAPVYIAEEISGNRFKIAGGEPGMRVSWQVTGSRQDPWAQAHPLVVEENKPENEQGYYRHPELYNRDQAQSIYRGVRSPELMR